ncbi:MAG: carboxy terminal-processing peptidase [Steroidobacteraceae bacterium]|nr:carboxy terminal-processing peptidase [Steroidobacteraceae bacterium]
MADPNSPTPADPAPEGRAASRLYGIGVRLALVLPALALLGLLFAGSAPNRSAAAPEAATVTLSLAPTDRHRKVARLVGEVIERSHYRQAVMDDELSSQVFDRYLESLDGNRSYFLASDVAELERYRTQLDDAIRTGNVEPAFVVFERFQSRNREVLQTALGLLEKEPDFALDERFVFDREHEPWPATVAAREDLWRQRVKNDAISLLLAGKTWPEAKDVLAKRYERVLKRVDQVTADDVFENFMNAYAHVFDPHSNYLSPRSSEEYNIAMKLSYVGIGASLQLVDDHVTVMNVIPGGPAAVSGLLKVNDRITAVGQGEGGEMVDVVGWRLDDVVQLIRGPAGSTVRLSILPAGATPGTKENLIAFERNKVTLEAQAAQKKVKTVKRGDRELKVGVIEVPSFYQDYDARVSGEKDFRSTTRDVSRLIGELKEEQVDGVVVDLRGNGGGHLSEATGLVGLFVRGGPVVQLRETGGRIEVLDDPEPGEVWDGPLVVLVDRSSASASEIFAAAIQDYGRGIVVGQQTYGKGTVQNLYPLDRWALGPNAGFGQLTVTIGKYYRITGDSVQNRGVVPEITLPSLISTTEVGESTRDSALPWDRIRPVDYDSDGGLASALAILARNHEARMKADSDLRALQADAASFEKQRAEKSLSLNLAARKAERERLDAERLARINARRVGDGQPALKSLEEVDPETEPDANLSEAAQILADLTLLPATGDAQLSQNRAAAR